MGSIILENRPPLRPRTSQLSSEIDVPGRPRLGPRPKMYRKMLFSDIPVAQDVLVLGSPGTSLYAEACLRNCRLKISTIFSSRWQLFHDIEKSWTWFWRSCRDAILFSNYSSIRNGTSDCLYSAKFSATSPDSPNDPDKPCIFLVLLKY